ncbi:MAG: 2-phospho-L-lactate guanylyltransferase [Acetobacteraceae bacterium]
MRRDAPIVALVPVRGFQVGKQRLALVLSAAERRDLVRAMLEDVLAALARVHRVALIAVVSADGAVARVAEGAHAIVLPDAPGGGLNPSLQAALAWVAATCPDHIAMVVAADLPALTPARLEAGVLASTADVVIARSLDGGTNLLLQQPPVRLAPAFGAGSSARHRDSATRAGLSTAVLDDPLLARDLDVPADLAAILPLLGSGRTLEVLRRCGPALGERVTAEQPAKGGMR